MSSETKPYFNDPYTPEAGEPSAPPPQACVHGTLLAYQCSICREQAGERRILWIPDGSSPAAPSLKENEDAVLASVVPGRGDGDFPADCKTVEALAPLSALQDERRKFEAWFTSDRIDALCGMGFAEIALEAWQARAALEAAPSLPQQDAVQVLRALVDRLEFVHNDDRYKSVWTLYMIHGGRYTEPKYDKEFETAKKYLASVPEAPNAQKDERDLLHDALLELSYVHCSPNCTGLCTSSMGQNIVKAGLQLLGGKLGDDFTYAADRILKSPAPQPVSQLSDEQVVRLAIPDVIVGPENRMGYASYVNLWSPIHPFLGSGRAVKFSEALLAAWTAARQHPTVVAYEQSLAEGKETK